MRRTFFSPMGPTAIAAFGLAGVPLVACTTDDGTAFTIEATTVSPATGPVAGGDLITITGDGFDDDAAGPAYVLVGGRLATTVTVISDTELQVVTPAGDAAGPAPIVVANRWGTTTLDGYAFNAGPTLTSLEPQRGPAAGGNQVTLRGTGFQAGDAGDPVVYFGGARAVSTTVVDDTTITAVPPVGADFSAARVTVRNRNGETPARTYRYGAGGLAVGLPSGGSLRFVVLDIFADELTVATSPAIFAASSDFRLATLTYSDGDLVGSERTGVFTTIDASGRVVVGSQAPFPSSTAWHQGALYTFSRQDGQLRRATSFAGPFTVVGSAPASGGNSLASDGEHLWFFSGSTLRELDPTTGQVVPDSEVEFSNIGQCPDLVATGGELYCLDSYNGWGVDRLDLKTGTGTRLYAFPANTTPHGMAVIP